MIALIAGCVLLTAALAFIVWLTKCGLSWSEWACCWATAIAFTAAVYIGLGLVTRGLA